jgi:cytochrome c biogenesis protein CcmG/thiol:disulfide interchange protein DsbE
VTTESTGGSKRRAVALIAIALAVVVAVLVIILATRPNNSGGDKARNSPLVGKLAPALDSQDLNGRPVRLSDYRGRFVVLNFFASWCVPCKVEHPELVQFSEREGAKGDTGAALVSVAYQDEPDVARDFFSVHGGNWPVVAQDSARIALDFGVVKLPESYLIDPNGKIVKKFEGGVTVAKLDEAIAANGGK